MTAKPVLVGLIGANIQQSLSPALFEDACSVAGLRGHYHLMDLDTLPGRKLEDLLSAARAAGFAGTNVTFPCKEAVLPLLDEVSAEAREIGAVNTVTIDRDGKTTGHNTDRIGFRRSFEETLGRDRVAGKTALLIGAGGAGRAVAFALFDLGLRTLLVNDRNKAQAEGLTAAVGAARCQIVDDAARALRGSAGLVNATPIGMSGFPGMPIDPASISASQFVADVIYSPLETALVKAAHANGSHVMGGAGMCVNQAAETFHLFTGKTADVGRMHRTFAEAAARRKGVSAAAT